MARKRLIAPEFFRHGDLYDAEERAGLPLRLAFAGLWTVTDRRGFFVWKPRELKVEVLPHDPVDFGAILDALEAAGFVYSYFVDGKKYGGIHSFGRWQTFHHAERPSDVPAPSQPEAETGAAPVQPRADLGLSPVSGRVSPTVTGTVAVTGTVTAMGGEKSPPRLELGFEDPPPAPPRLKLSPKKPAVEKPPDGEAKYPGFPRELCNAAHARWLKVGSVEYGFFRKLFGPLFAVPEASRDPDLPRNDELIPAMEWYINAVYGSNEARFRTPQKCADSLSLIVGGMREYFDDPDEKLSHIRRLIGITSRPNRAG